MKENILNNLVLASASPRRKMILEQVNAKFDVVISNQNEVITKDTPCEAVKELAFLKAKSVYDKVDKSKIVIGADTIVVYNNKILGKPKNIDDARKMIELLQGNIHQVYTGVCIISKDKLDKFYVSTDVEIKSMSKEEIENYIITKEPYDKAGAYAIQGIFAKYIKRIDGDYYNVMGLPISEIYDRLKNL